MKTEEYLELLTGQIRCKAAREPVGNEIRRHIEDQKNEFLSEGMDGRMAGEKAVLEMGDPVEAGIALDRIHRPKMAWGMILLIWALSLSGMIIQYIMDAGVTGVSFLSGNGYWQLFYMVAGLIIMMGICFWDYSRIGYRARELTLLLFAVLFFGRMFFGLEMNGGRAWIAMPGVMPVSIHVAVFLFAPLYGAVVYGYRGQGYRAVGKCILWMIPAVRMELLCPSLAGALIMALTFAVILSVAVCKNWFQISRLKMLTVIWGSITLIPAGIFYAVLRHGADYQQARLQAFFNPASPGGYTGMVLRDILAGCKLIGGDSGLILKASQRLPQEGRDYVITYMFLYYGILTAVALVGLMAFLFLRFFRVSLRQMNQLGMLMGTGCSVVLLIQIFLYVLANTGIFLSGTSCPFVTSGGSQILVTYILLGILLSICRHQNVIPCRPVMKAKKRTYISPAFRPFR